MAGPTSLRTRLRNRYERGGLRGVVAGFPRFFQYRVLGPGYKLGARWFLNIRCEEPLNRTALLDRAERAGQLVRIGDEEEVTIDAGAAIDELPRPLREVCGTYTIPSSFVATLGPAKLIGKNGIGFTESNEPILETTEGSKAILRDHLADEFRRSGIRTTLRAVESTGRSADPTRDHEFAAPLIKPPSTNYYHWILGYLGKLITLERYRSRTGRFPTLLLTEDAPSWVSDSLELAGLESKRAEPWSGGGKRIGELAIPSHPLRYTSDPLVSPTVCRELADRMVAAAGPIEDAPERIYVSRRDAVDRRVRNEAELDTVLDNFDITQCVLSERPIREQVALFNRAEMIIGPHGAGLTNLLFADDPTVLELFPEEGVRPHYFVLARLLGFEYDYLACRSVQDDLLIDPERLNKKLAQALE